MPSCSSFLENPSDLFKVCRKQFSPLRYEIKPPLSVNFITKTLSTTSLTSNSKTGRSAPAISARVSSLIPPDRMNLPGQFLTDFHFHLLKTFSKTGGKSCTIRIKSRSSESTVKKASEAGLEPASNRLASRSLCH